MRRIVRLLALVLALICAPAVAAPSDTAITFRVPVVPETARYLDLLAAPSYLALALENNGFSPSLSSRMTLNSRESFQIKAGILTYTGRKGPVFDYDAGLNLSLGVSESKFTIPVEVDTSELSRGTIVVRVYPPLAKLFPRELIDRIDFKIRTLANLPAQHKVLDYLDQLAKAERARGRGFDGLLEAIAFDAYNHSIVPSQAAPGCDRGEATPLSDQIVLLLTLAIWIVGFPVLVYYVRARRKAHAAE